MSVEIKETNFENYGKCVKLSNGLIDVLVTIDFGPRIIYFGFTGQKNILYNDIERKYVTSNSSITERYGNNSAFFHYGGHRLCLSPKKMPDTFYPDNEPVTYSILPEGVSFTPPRQKKNDIQLSIEVIMSEGTEDIMVVHSAKNYSKERQTLALSAITMFNRGGLEVIPLNTQNDNPLIPNRTIALWPDTTVSDQKIFIGNKFVTINCNENLENNIKLGINNTCGWVSYSNQDYTLIKRYVHNAQAAYPDFGCSCETFVCNDYVELETLSPLYNLEPGDAIRHVENIFISKSVPDANPNDEEKIDKFFNET